MNHNYAIDNARKLLADQINKMTSLLDTLEEESANMSDYHKKIFASRLRILDDMIDIAVYYDEAVFKYVRFHPAGHNTKHLEDQLKVARKYIERTGGDWSVVQWGKLSDY